MTFIIAAKQRAMFAWRLESKCEDYNPKMSGLKCLKVPWKIEVASCLSRLFVWVKMKMNAPPLDAAVLFCFSCIRSKHFDPLRCTVPKVDYSTFDISAHRDVKYVAAKGTIRFEKGAELSNSQASP